MGTVEPEHKYRNGNGGARRQLRNSYLIANAFELFVALLAIVAAISYLLDPQNLSNGTIGHVQFPDALWFGLYGVGSILVVIGLVRISPRIEVMGLCLFCASVLIQALAIAQLRGWPSAASIAIYTGFAIASILRSYVLVKAVVVYRHDVEPHQVQR